MILGKGKGKGKGKLIKHSDVPSYRSSVFSRIFKRKRRYVNKDVAPDEIFIDSSNLPNFDTDQFEGRIERPISQKTIYFTALIFAIIGIVYAGQSFKLQLVEGDSWTKRAENNRLNNSLIFAERGVIQDRNGMLLAWNETDPAQTDYPLRKYRETGGTHNLIGYVKYPRKDKAGFYYNTEYDGADGAEDYFDPVLKGEPGVKLTETTVSGEVISESVMRPPKKGTNITLTIDGRLQEFMYESIKEINERSNFTGGAGIMMDIETGEVIASVSFPEYDSNTMTAGTSTEIVRGYLTDTLKPFLDRVSQGLYTPGSIVKPIFALAALQEGVIAASKQIESTGELRLPNPYRPGEYSIFKDWKAHGFTDMRRAIAVSSDVYFYQIGGGFMSQKGLGILKIDEYSKLFGLGEPVFNGFFKGKAGVIPTPEWKALNFKGDIWRVGDTYNTSIGQYGYQITPTQAVRAIAALANGGKLIDPHLFKSVGVNDEHLVSLTAGLNKTPLTDEQIEPRTAPTTINIPQEYFRVVQEGMRMTVTEGTMTGLNFSFVKIAGKTGTAQLGVAKDRINSWSTGYFPYDKPKYAFVFMLENGPSNLIFGASAAVGEFMNKVQVYAPEYFQAE